MDTSRSLVSLAQSQPPYFAGIDVGGTNIKVGVVDDSGQTLGYASVRTKIEKGPEAGSRRMAKTLRQVAEEAGLRMVDLAYVGLATPGTMDVPAGMLLHPVNLPGWHEFSIRDRVSHHCGRPVAFANDANAAAFGEWWVGSGRQYHSMILLTLGTGVGGGIIIGDLSIDGEHSHGSEVGHIIIDWREDARMCNAGRGHLEAYASATALVERTREALALEEGSSSLLEDSLNDDSELTSLRICQAAEGGDALARRIILETARYLGVGIASLVHTIDPGAVLIGGAMTFGRHETQTGRDFLAAVQKEVRERVFSTIADKVVIDYASLGGDAGYIGAAGIARAAFGKERNTPTVQ